MKLLKHIINIAILLGFLIYDLVNAQNFNDALRLSEPGLTLTPRALALGGSYTALSNDYGGAFYNPAGLGLVKKKALFGGLNYNLIKNNAVFFGNDAEDEKSNTQLSQFGITFPVATIRGSLVFSLAYTKTKDFSNTFSFSGFNRNSSMINNLTSSNDDIPYLLGVSYPLYNNAEKYLGDTTIINGGLLQSGEVTEKGDLNTFSLAGSVEMAKGVFVGASLDILGGTYNRSREYTEDDVKNNYVGLTDPGDSTTRDFQSFYINDILDWDLSGWNLKLGVLYKLNPIMRVGAAIKFPSYYTVEERYFVDGESQFGSGQVYYLDPVIDNRTEYKIKTPYEFSGGAALDLNQIVVAADFKFIDYTQMEFTDGLPVDVIAQNNRDIQELFRSTLNYGFGIEYTLPVFNLSLRGGYRLIQSPYKNDPTEFDKQFFTMGVGIAPRSDFSIDLAYAHGWWQTYNDNYGVNESRTFQEINRNSFVVSFVLRY